MRQQRALYGCITEGRLWVSRTRPDVSMRRCPRAFLNPDTELYDPVYPELISMAADSEATGLAWTTGGLAEQPAWFVDVLRLVRGTQAAMHNLVMRARRKASK